VDRADAERHPEALQQRTCLRVGEREVTDPHLAEPIGEPVAVERQHGVHASEQHQAQSAERVPQEEVHLLGQRAGDHLVAVEHHRHRSRRRGDRRGEIAQLVAAQWRLRQRCRAAGPDVEAQPAEALGHRTPEGQVLRFEGDPPGCAG
jgi:hypothetical protein